MFPLVVDLVGLLRDEAGSGAGTNETTDGTGDALVVAVDNVLAHQLVGLLVSCGDRRAVDAAAAPGVCKNGSGNECRCQDG